MSDAVERRAEQLRIMFEQHRDLCWEQVYLKREHGADWLAREFAARAEVWDLAARCVAERFNLPTARQENEA